MFFESFDHKLFLAVYNRPSKCEMKIRTASVPNLFCDPLLSRRKLCVFLTIKVFLRQENAPTYEVWWTCGMPHHKLVSQTTSSHGKFNLKTWKSTVLVGRRRAAGDVAVWFCGGVGLWWCGDMVVWLRGTVVLWEYGSMVACDCGVVVVYDCSAVPV